MGQEIEATEFSEQDHARFHTLLREETATLKHWFDTRRFDYSSDISIGLELEAWLVDENALPCPRNEAFLGAVNDPDIVEELAAFNFEINTPPRKLGGSAMAQTEADLNKVWDKCVGAAGRLGMRPVAVGILPTVRDDMLQPDWMSDANRYRALNRELYRRRQRQPVHIAIKGLDELDYRCDHIMLEAACTSLQAHMKVNQEDAVRFYNAAILAAGPLLAATANSPFLYGKSLWCETRIPAFEQATAIDGFRDLEGRNMLRVTLGSGFLRHSFLELFLENLSYPTLLPQLSEVSDRLPHLRLHNGTVWRWVRPILGFDGAGEPHLRIEHRVIPAGPTLADSTANLALCHGLMLALGRAETPPEAETGFEAARANFYACARDGLGADVMWAGQRVNVQSLLIEDLLPKARAALDEAGEAHADLQRYFDEILMPRIRTGRTGAAWQRSYIDTHGADFQGMTETYMAHQTKGLPVHEWEV